MARLSDEPSKNAGGIPKWFVTYSDVITLLMTFFILLMTFANSEPEKFELMQQSLFGAGGSAGNVGKRVDALDKPTIVVRARPASSRLTIRGTEIPPMYSDPINQAVGKGLSSLEQQNVLATERTFALDVSMPLFVDVNDQLTTIARQHLKLIANQMTRLPISIKIVVGSSSESIAAAKMATYLSTNLRVLVGRVSIEVATRETRPPTGLRLILRHEI